MRKIVDYDLQQRDEGVGFRLLFDDHTWTDSNYVIPNMKLKYDCEGFSREEANLSYFLSDVKDESITEEKFIEILRKTVGLSGYVDLYVANYVEYDLTNKKTIKEEHVIINDPEEFEYFSGDREPKVDDRRKVEFNKFNEFRYLDEDKNILYYTYLEVFQNLKEVKNDGQT